MPEDDLTVDDLSPLAVQVAALREDLAAYRSVLDLALRRRLWALASVTGGLVILLLAIGAGGFLLLAHERDRAALTLEASRLEACTAARTVQNRTLEVLAAIDEHGDPSIDRPWLPVALERLSADPCATGSDD